MIILIGISRVAIEVEGYFLELHLAWELTIAVAVTTRAKLMVVFITAAIAKQTSSIKLAFTIHVIINSTTIDYSSNTLPHDLNSS